MSDIKERDRISFRLRSMDQDLRDATKGLASDKISDLARDGLRLILGIRTTKRVEVSERPINVVGQMSPQRTTDVIQTSSNLIQSPPVVFRPSNILSKGGR